ncbi:TolC family protein [Variovorax sp. J22R24]|uniref:TolC family protein n=1 Tax=Variovorax gracilis TaxID=3053502 RepID=UPI0025787F95|nr:TolC family protein [Variovorax sp. J22R24]MDM0107460.1 TolC family protein [Variovorax sp. J22R24]
MRIRQQAACAAFFMGAMAIAPAWAQTSQRLLTLDEVLRAARDNPDVMLSRQSLAAARADVLAADHAPPPLLTAKSSTIDLQNGVGGGDIGRKRVDNSLGIDWTWERGGKRSARTTAAERAADAALADVDDVQVQQLIAAGSAFFDLLGAQERIVEVNAVERSAQQLSDASARRVQAGDLPAQEAARTAIEAQRSRVDLRAAELDRERAQISLTQLLGPGAAVRGLAANADWPALTLPAGDTDLDALVDARSDVRAAQARVASTDAALAAAQAQRSADVVWGVSLDRYPGTSNRLLEVRAVVPLHWGYQFEGEIGRAQAVYTQAQDALARKRHDAKLELQRLRDEAEANARRLQIFEKDILASARQVADNAELAYRKGAMSLSDLLDARRTLRATQLDAIAARVDHAKAALAWRLRTQPMPTP